MFYIEFSEYGLMALAGLLSLISSLEGESSNSVKYTMNV